MKLLITLLLVLTACGSTESPVSPATLSASPTATPSNTTSNSIASGTICSKLDTGIGTSLDLVYGYSLYTSGDRYVYCEISDSSHTYSSDFIYKSGTTGATAGNCNLIYDVDAASFGFWTFTLQGTTAKTKYTDSASAHNNYTYTFATGDCSPF